MLDKRLDGRIAKLSSSLSSICERCIISGSRRAHLARERHGVFGNRRLNAFNGQPMRMPTDATTHADTRAML